MAARSMPTINLPTQLKAHLEAGHPWVYRDHVPPSTRLASGTWVRLHCGNWQGFGLWDARSPIALRIFSSRMQPDANWIKTVVQQAWQAREPLRQTATTAYRLLFGEGDGLPGITVDLYNQYAVIATYADCVEVLIADVVKALQANVPQLRGVVRRRRDDSENDDETGKIELLWGELPPAQLVVEEHGLKLIANLFEGQKTGLFLDHRENRHTIEQWSHGKTVLNCFSYTGAFSLYAARGGATATTSVDIAPAAAHDAEQNFILNGLMNEHQRFLARDCFDFLSRTIQRGETYDLVILDPPSFARSKKNIHAATRAYVKLNALAIQCVAKGGLLASASCTSQLSPANFRLMLGEAAAQTDQQLRIIHEAGQALDHPVPAHFNEGRYLKFVLARVDERM